MKTIKRVWRVLVLLVVVIFNSILACVVLFTFPLWIGVYMTWILIDDLWTEAKAKEVQP